jgi:ketosteroid isomerase-like protein
MSNPISPAAAAIALAGCGAAAAPAAQAPAADPMAGRDLAAEVRAAADEFDKAQLEHDGATIDRYLAADFVFVRGSGRKTDRADFLATFTEPTTTFEPFILEDRAFIVAGRDAVIATAKATLKGVEGGAAFEEHFRYADVFAWRDGRWQVIYVQVTPLKQP